jgi:hypothetical protein
MMDWRRQRSVVGFWFLIVSMAGRPSAAESIPLRIQPRTLTQTIEGTAVDFVVSGDVDLVVEEDVVRADIVATLALTDLQGKIALLLRARGEKHEECGDRISLHTIDLRPAGEAAELFVAGRYERWGCLGSLKTRVLSQSGSAKLWLTPRLEDAERVGLASEIRELEADGLLGTLLADSFFGPTLRDELVALIRSALNTDQLSRAFPEELKPFHPVLDRAAFLDLGGGQLGLRVVGRLTGSTQELFDLIQRLGAP